MTKPSPHYYPFGSLIPNRSWSDVSRVYRYGFGNLEKEFDLGEGLYITDFRGYDSRLGRWMSIDPESHNMPDFSPYNSNFNSPIIFKDKNGKCPILGIFVGMAYEFTVQYFSNVFKCMKANGFSFKAWKEAGIFGSGYFKNNDFFDGVFKCAFKKIDYIGVALSGAVGGLTGIFGIKGSKSLSKIGKFIIKSGSSLLDALFDFSDEKGLETAFINKKDKYTIKGIVGAGLTAVLSVPIYEGQKNLMDKIEAEVGKFLGSLVKPVFKPMLTSFVLNFKSISSDIKEYTKKQFENLKHNVNNVLNTAHIIFTDVKDKVNDTIDKVLDKIEKIVNKVDDVKPELSK